MIIERIILPQKFSFRVYDFLQQYESFDLDERFYGMLEMQQESSLEVTIYFAQ
jgi:hypothetical protein